MNDFQINNCCEKTAKKDKFFLSDAFKMFFVTVLSALVLSVFVAVIFLTDDASTPMFWAGQLLFSLLLGGIAFAFSKVCGNSFVQCNSLNTVPKAIDILLVLLAVFFLLNGMIMPNQWFCDFIEGMGLNRPDVSFSQDDLANNWAIALPAICLVAPFAEELIFRGTIANGLLNGFKNKYLAMLLGGILFSIFHMNPAQTLHQFLLGSVLVLFVFKGSFWTALIGHVFNNVMVVLLAFAVEPTGFYQNNAFFCTIAGLLLFLVVVVVKLLLLTEGKKNLQNVGNFHPKPSGGSVVMLVVSVSICLALWVVNLVG